MFNFLLSIIPSIVYFFLHVTNPNSFPKSLSEKEERQLIERMEAGEVEAKQKLIEHNLRLVAHVAKKYYSSADPDDLISIGTIGLIKGVSSFNSEKGIKLATYAARCIDNEILMYFRSVKKTAQDVYISDPLETDKDGNTLTLIDVIADDCNVEESIDIKMKLEKLFTFIEESLTEREKQIISMRYGLYGYDSFPQREVAKVLGISRSYVSRIETKALLKLRKRFEN